MLKHLLTILLMLSLYVPFVEGGMSYCQQADEAARMTDRRMAYPNPNGDGYQIMLDVGECDAQSDSCVMKESYGPCGGIKQLIDSWNDGTCDYMIEWKSIVDPQYGVFFGIHKISKCPLII